MIGSLLFTPVDIRTISEAVFVIQIFEVKTFVHFHTSSAKYLNAFIFIPAKLALFSDLKKADALSSSTKSEGFVFNYPRALTMAIWVHHGAVVIFGMIKLLYTNKRTVSSKESFSRYNAF